MLVVLLLTNIPQPEIIRRINGPLDGYVVLQFGHREPLECIDILDGETLKDGTDVRVKNGEIFPDFDGEDESTQKETTPVNGVEREVSEFYHAFDVD